MWGERGVHTRGAPYTGLSERRALLPFPPRQRAALTHLSSTRSRASPSSVRRLLSGLRGLMAVAMALITKGWAAGEAGPRT